MFDKIKDATYVQKFQLLVSHQKEMLDTIKKDLKQEHLAQDRVVHKKYFGNRPLHRITLDELAAVYIPLLAESEQCGEFVASRWVFKHMEIYEFFSRKLEQLNADFEQLTELDPQFSHQITEEATAAFGPKATLIFCVLNSVIIRSADFQTLKSRAEKEEVSSEAIARPTGDGETRRVEQRYQRKLEGLERKYKSEVKALKSQIAHLSRRLAGEMCDSQR